MSESVRASCRNAVRIYIYIYRYILFFVALQLNTHVFKFDQAQSLCSKLMFGERAEIEAAYCWVLGWQLLDDMHRS